MDTSNSQPSSPQARLRITEYKFENLAEINKALVKHKHPTEAHSNLPSIGYVIRNGNDFVAAGFLRKMEANMGMIDSYVTNPDQEASVRHDALDLLTRRLLADARQLGMKRVIMFSKDDSIFKRAEKYKFVKTDSVLAVKEIF